MYGGGKNESGKSRKKNKPIHKFLVCGSGYIVVIYYLFQGGKIPKAAVQRPIAG
jgi:hypothetical protein